MAEHTVAAPPMSALMMSMFAEALMEMPPLWGTGPTCAINVEEGGLNHVLRKEHGS